MYAMAHYIHFRRGIVNRNWFIYKNLLKHYKIEKIILIDFLPYNILSFFRSLVFRYRLHRHEKIIKKKFLNTLFCINDNHYLIIAPIAFLSTALFKKQLLFYLAALNITEAWSWSYNPLDTTFLDKAIFKKSIFDTVDDWRYHSIFSKWKKSIDKNYKQIAFKADIIFSVSISLAHTFNEEWGRHINIVSNGIECINSAEKSTKNNQIKTIVYIGTLEARIDVELLSQVVAKNQDKRFVFIGPVWADIKQYLYSALADYENCKFLGRMPYNNTKKYLSSCDVGIVPHKRTLFTSSNDPLKIYDYLSAGLPVVTTVETSESIINNLLYLATNAESFNQKLHVAIKEDSESMQKKRKNIVKQYKWSDKVNQMLTIIEKND